MRIDDLPRPPTDEDRDTLNDHAAVAGFPSNPSADLTSPEFDQWRDQRLVEIADDIAAIRGAPATKASRNRHPARSSFFARWRLRRLQRSIATAQEYLAACQHANDEYGVYDELVSEAERELARLQRRRASLKG